MNKAKGFTLLELLVVAATISLLSSIVVASTARARDKAEDIKIISEMKKVQADAELLYEDMGRVYWIYDDVTKYRWDICNASKYGDPQGDYGTVPGSRAYEDMLIGRLILHQIKYYDNFVTQGDGVDGQYNRTACHDEKVSAYVFQAPLTRSTPTEPRFWCIDSAGASHFTSTPLPRYTYECPL